MTGRERAFRLVLHLYPAAFRARYGDEIVQLCQDDLRDAATPGARRGPGRTLLANLVDVGVNGLVERISNGGALAPSATLRLLGLLGVAGGLILVSAFLFFIPGTFNVGRLVLFNAGAVAITIAVCRLERDRLGWLGIAISVFVVVANVTYAAGTLYTAQFEHPFAGGRGVVFAWLGHAMWLADSLFATVVLRLGRVARLAALALALGGVAIVGIAPGLRSLWEPNELMQALALAGVALNGLGWILLGLVVAFRGRTTEPVPEASQPA
jgi:hypothetical protein